MSKIKCKQHDTQAQQYCLTCGFYCDRCAAYHNRITNHPLKPITDHITNLYNSVSAYENVKAQTMALQLAKNELIIFIDNQINKAKISEQPLLTQLNKAYSNVANVEKLQIKAIIRESLNMFPPIENTFMNISDKLRLLECKAKSFTLRNQFIINEPVAFNSKTHQLLDFMMDKQFGSNKIRFLIGQNLEDLKLLANSSIPNKANISWKNVLLLATIFHALVSKNKSLYEECNSLANIMLDNEINELKSYFLCDHLKDIEDSLKNEYKTIAIERLKSASIIIKKAMEISNDIDKTTNLDEEVAHAINSPMHNLLLSVTNSKIMINLSQLHNLQFADITNLKSTDINNRDFTKIQCNFKLLENIKHIMCIYLGQSSQMKSLQTLKTNIGIKKSESLMENKELFNQYIITQQNIFNKWNEQTKLEIIDALDFIMLDKLFNNVDQNKSAEDKNCYAEIVKWYNNMFKNSVVGHQSLPLYNDKVIYYLIQLYRVRGHQQGDICKTIEKHFYQCSSMLLYKILKESQNSDLDEMERILKKSTISVLNGYLNCTPTKHKRRLIFLYGTLDMVVNTVVSENHIKNVNRIINTSEPKILKICFNPKQKYEQNIKLIKTIEQLIFSVKDIQMVVIIQFDKLDDIDYRYLVLKNLHYKLSFVQIPFGKNFSLGIENINSNISDKAMILSYLQALMEHFNYEKNKILSNLKQIREHILQNKLFSDMIIEILLLLLHPQKITYSNLYSPIINKVNTNCLYNNFMQIDETYFKESIKIDAFLVQNGIIDCICYCIQNPQNVNEKYLMFIFSEIKCNENLELLKEDNLLLKKSTSYLNNRKGYTLTYLYSLSVYNKIINGGTILLTESQSIYKELLMGDLSNLFKENTKLDMCYFMAKGTELKLEKHLITAIYMISSAIQYFKEAKPKLESTISLVLDKCVFTTMSEYDRYITDVAQECLGQINVSCINNDNILDMLSNWMLICKHDSNIANAQLFEDIYIIVDMKIKKNLFNKSDISTIITEFERHIIELAASLNNVANKDIYYYRLQSLLESRFHVVKNIEIIFTKLINKTDIDIAEIVNQLLLYYNAIDKRKDIPNDIIVERVCKPLDFKLKQILDSLFDKSWESINKYTKDSMFLKWFEGIANKICAAMIYKILNKQSNQINQDDIYIYVLLKFIIEGKLMEYSTRLLNCMLSYVSKDAIIESTYPYFYKTAEATLYIIPITKEASEEYYRIFKLISENRLTTTKKIKWIISDKTEVSISLLILVYGTIYPLHLFGKIAKQYLEMIEDEWKADGNYRAFVSLINAVVPLLDFTSLFDQLVYSVIIQMCSMVYKIIDYWEHKENFPNKIESSAFNIDESIHNMLVHFLFMAINFHKSISKEPLQHFIKELKLTIIACIDYFSYLRKDNSSRMEMGIICLMNTLSYMDGAIYTLKWENNLKILEICNHAIRYAQSQHNIDKYLGNREKIYKYVQIKVTALDCYPVNIQQIIHNALCYSGNIKTSEIPSYDILQKDCSAFKSKCPALEDLRHFQLINAQIKHYFILTSMLAKLNKHYSYKLSLTSPLLEQSTNSIFDQLEIQTIASSFAYLKITIAPEKVTISEFIEIIHKIEGTLTHFLNTLDVKVSKRWERIESYYKEYFAIKSFSHFYSNDIEISNTIEKYKIRCSDKFEDAYDIELIDDIIQSHVIWMKQILNSKEVLLIKIKCADKVYRFEFRLYYREVPNIIKSFMNLFICSKRNGLKISFDANCLKIEKSNSWSHEVCERNQLKHEYSNGRLLLLTKSEPLNALKYYVYPELIISLAQLEGPYLEYYICIGELIGNKLKELRELSTLSKKGGIKIEGIKCVA